MRLDESLGLNASYLSLNESHLGLSLTESQLLDENQLLFESCELKRYAPIENEGEEEEEQVLRSTHVTSEEAKLKPLFHSISMGNIAKHAIPNTDEHKDDEDNKDEDHDDDDEDHHHELQMEEISVVNLKVSEDDFDPDSLDFDNNVGFDNSVVNRNVKYSYYYS